MPFLGTFTNMRTVTICFVMSACLSIHMEELGYHWRNFHEIRYEDFLKDLSKKIQILLISDKNNFN